MIESASVDFVLGNDNDVDNCVDLLLDMLVRLGDLPESKILVGVLISETLSAIDSAREGEEDLNGSGASFDIGSEANTVLESLRGGIFRSARSRVGIEEVTETSAKTNGH